MLRLPICLLMVPCLFAQQADFTSFGMPLKTPTPDPAIQNMLSEVSEANVRQTVEKLVSFRNRNTIAGTDSATDTRQAADWIEEQLKSYSAACGGCLEVKRDTWTEGPEPRVPKPAQMTNIYAILRGSDPAQAKRVNLVTGHYDSRATDPLNVQGFALGANDDASGVAVSLECARVLSKGHWPSTLVFAAVTGEEQGLYGSRHLAQLAKQEGWQIEGVLNNDIVGGNTTPGDRNQRKSVVRIFSAGEHAEKLLNLGMESDSPSREMARRVEQVARTYTPGFSAALEMRRDRYLRGGDHLSFNAEGFPAVRFSEWREDFNHQHRDVRVQRGLEYGDLVKFVDFAYVAQVARLNAAVLAANASAPGPPRNVRMDTKALDNNSTLHWDAPEGAPAGTRYEVLWRETAAADWQFGTDAGETTQITVPVSKDNVIFGVESVDTAGHGSPAAAAE